MGNCSLSLNSTPVSDYTENEINWKSYSFNFSIGQRIILRILFGSTNSLTGGAIRGCIYILRPMESVSAHSSPSCNDFSLQGRQLFIRSQVLTLISPPPTNRQPTNPPDPSWSGNNVSSSQCSAVVTVILYFETVSSV